MENCVQTVMRVGFFSHWPKRDKILPPSYTNPCFLLYTALLEQEFLFKRYHFWALIFKLLKEPKNPIPPSWVCLAVRYDNPIPSPHRLFKNSSTVQMTVIQRACGFSIYNRAISFTVMSEEIMPKFDDDLFVSDWKIDVKLFWGCGTGTVYCIWE